MKPGDVLPPRRYRVGLPDLVRYAGAGGDFNPIHWNQRVARSVGLPDVIAHGMFTMAQAGRYVTDWAADPGAIESFDVRFTAPVVVPDETGAVLEVSGTIAEVLDGGRIVVDLVVTCDDIPVLKDARAVVRTTARR